MQKSFLPKENEPWNWQKLIDSFARYLICSNNFWHSRNSNWQPISISIGSNRKFGTWLSAEYMHIKRVCERYTQKLITVVYASPFLCFSFSVMIKFVFISNQIQCKNRTCFSYSVCLNHVSIECNVLCVQ